MGKKCDGKKTEEWEQENNEDDATEATAEETLLPTKGVDDDAAGATAEGEKETREIKDSTGELPPIAFFYYWSLSILTILTLGLCAHMFLLLGKSYKHELCRGLHRVCDLCFTEDKRSCRSEGNFLTSVV